MYRPTLLPGSTITSIFPTLHTVSTGIIQSVVDLVAEHESKDCLLGQRGKFHMLWRRDLHTVVWAIWSAGECSIKHEVCTEIRWEPKERSTSEGKYGWGLSRWQMHHVIEPRDSCSPTPSCYTFLLPTPPFSSPFGFPEKGQVYLQIPRPLHTETDEYVVF